MTLRSEFPRKLVHVCMGAFALLLRWLTPWQAAFMAVAALILNSFFLHRVTRGVLLRPEERISRFSRGVVLYPAMLLLTFAVFQSRLELAAGIWALLAVGDGMAALSGLALRGPRLPWNRKKTWSGLVAFVLFGTAACAWIIRWTQRAGTLTMGGRLGSGGLLTLGGSDASGRIGDAFLLDDPVGAATAASGSLAFLVVGCLVATTAAALVESLDTSVDDNILVPVVGGTVLWLATLVDPAMLVAGGESGSWLGVWLTGAAITVPVAAMAYLAGAVDRSGVVAGVLLATVLYVYAAWPGLVMLGGIMVISAGVTRLGHTRKEVLGVVEGRDGSKGGGKGSWGGGSGGGSGGGLGGAWRGGCRGLGSVGANAGAGVAFAFLAVVTPHPGPFTIAMVAAFATSLFDTTATEVGQAFGRRHVLVTTWRAVPAGTTGGVSAAGTLAGVLAATVLAGVAWVMGLVAGVGAMAVILGALFGSTLESFAGATMGKGTRSDHHLRNLANTVAGAAVAWGLMALLAYLGGPTELP